ncbi:MAG: protein BatD, partial [bacterium]|nr:protein BatD [bacterium]
MRGLRALVLAFACCLAAVPASAQRAHIQISSGPYFQGEAVDVHLVVEEFEQSPTPEVEVEPPAGVRLDFAGMNPSTRSSISIVNGRMIQTKEVRFVFRYRFVASEAGRFAVGPFRVTQGGVTRTTGPVQLDVEPVGKSDRVRIKASWPRGEVFPGQRFAVELQWWFEADLSDRMRDYRIEVPIFNRADLFRYVDEPTQSGDTELVVQTATGPVTLRAQVVERMEGARRFKVVSAKRILIPLRPGKFEFSGATVMVEEVVRWRRDLFGQRTPQSVRKLPTIDDRRSLVVSDVPRAGRPDSYAGAIGRGFSLEASADRSVVQAGDPIELTFVLRGDGNLDGAGLPDLAAGAGLSPDLFRVPPGEPRGVVKDGAKTFRMQLRVLDASVREIPPIAYSYFDTEKKAYVTVESRPIALSVRRARVITAADVVSGAEPSDARAGRDEQQSEAPEAAAAPAATLVLTGANLSIVREPEKLLRHGDGSRATAGVVLLYLVGVAT